MQDRRLLPTNEGRIAVGWLIIEDLFMVATLVLLPPLAELITAFDNGAEASGPSMQDIGITLAWTFGKVAVFVAVMLVAGRRLVPWLLHLVAHTGSRELFRLAVLSIALGIAFGAAALFGVSFALGAFFAGMILSESELSHQAAQETLPLRDAFAVLFFVSVGMLLDPTILIDQFWLLLATLLIVTVGKSVAAFAIVLAFGHPRRTAFIISASLAQIGEFSFILAGLGMTLGLLPEQGHDLVLAAAIVSILLNPAFFLAIDWLDRRSTGMSAIVDAQSTPGDKRPQRIHTTFSGHSVLIGFGRVGRTIGSTLRNIGLPLYVIEHQAGTAAKLAADGIDGIEGNAADPSILATANLPDAACLFVAIPDSFEAGQIVEQARQINPTLKIIARAHSDAEMEHLTRLGASQVVSGENELALGMVRAAALPGRPGDGEAGGDRQASESLVADRDTNA
jgi:CPA2 family monovalent cation:H+ antiporter-2